MFKERIKKTVIGFGIVFIGAFFTTIFVYGMKWVNAYGIPDILETILFWLCLFILGCMILWGLANAMKEIVYFIRWLFIEPYQEWRKQRNEGREKDQDC